MDSVDHKLSLLFFFCLLIVFKMDFWTEVHNSTTDHS